MLMLKPGHGDTITQYDEFCGVGGFGQAGKYVPGVVGRCAVNHDADAVKAYRLMHPGVDVRREDVRALDMTTVPPAVLGTYAPACPPFSDAKGLRVDFDVKNSGQTMLGDAADYDDEDPDEARRERRRKARRERLLMNEIITHLRAMIDRDEPVLIGVIENVWQARKWSEWTRFRRIIHSLGYKTHLMMTNAMHVRPVHAPLVPQSRNRLKLAFWHVGIGRDPDFDKWVERPKAYCPRCDRTIDAIKIWNKPDDPIFGEAGVYGVQYTYRCPAITCRGREVFPEVVPALAAIDPTIPGIRIGDRPSLGMNPLVPNTMGRIIAGRDQFWAPTFDSRRTAGIPRQRSAGYDGAAMPLMLPLEGRPGKQVTPADRPLRTQTTRAENAVMSQRELPFLIPMRGGGDKNRARPVWGPMHAVTANGNHHGLASLQPHAVPDGVASLHDPTLRHWYHSLLVPYYGTARSARPATEPIGTLTTRDRHAVMTAPTLFDTVDPAVDLGGAVDLADRTGTIDVNDIYIRVLDPHEVQVGMGFELSYETGARSKRVKVKLWGNAVPPAVGECIIAALVECLTGEQLDRGPW